MTHSITRNEPALMATQASNAQPASTTGIAKGLFAVVLFAMTVPMTKLALPLFGPEMIASSRAFIAGLLSLFVIILNDWPLPDKKTIAWIIFAGLGIVVGFPYLLSYSLVNLSAANMGVVLAGLPLMTSIFAAVIMHERHNRRFWISSALGAILLAGYFLNGATSSGWSTNTLIILFFVLLLGGLGYSAGAKAAKTIGGWQTICWMLAFYLPLSSISLGYFSGDDAFLQALGSADKSAESEHAAWVSLLALMYLAVISQWWGFRFWYQAMAEAGAGRISQIQLLQPFFTLLFAVIFLAESFDIEQGLFALLIVVAICSALKSK